MQSRSDLSTLEFHLSVSLCYFALFAGERSTSVYLGFPTADPLLATDRVSCRMSVTFDSYNGGLETKLLFSIHVLAALASLAKAPQSMPYNFRKQFFSRAHGCYHGISFETAVAKRSFMDFYGN